MCGVDEKEFYVTEGSDAFDARHFVFKCAPASVDSAVYSNIIFCVSSKCDKGNINLKVNKHVDSINMQPIA